VFDISLHKQDELSLVTKYLQNEHVTSGWFYIILDVQKIISGARKRCSRNLSQLPIVSTEECISSK
jgi:hypothetical protein